MWKRNRVCEIRTHLSCVNRTCKTSASCMVPWWARLGGQNKKNGPLYMPYGCMHEQPNAPETATKSNTATKVLILINMSTTKTSEVGEGRGMGRADSVSLFRNLQNTNKSHWRQSLRRPTALGGAAGPTPL